MPTFVPGLALALTTLALFGCGTDSPEDVATDAAPADSVAQVRDVACGVVVALAPVDWVQVVDEADTSSLGLVPDSSVADLWPLPQNLLRWVEDRSDDPALTKAMEETEPVEGQTDGQWVQQVFDVHAATCAGEAALPGDADARATVLLSAGCTILADAPATEADEDMFSLGPEMYHLSSGAMKATDTELLGLAVEMNQVAGAVDEISTADRDALVDQCTELGL